MANYKSVKRNKIAIVVLFLLVAVLAVGVVTTLFRVNTQIQTQTLTSINYEVGSLSDSDGTEVDSTGSIRSKELHNIDGLTIKSKADSKVTYKLYCYDKDGKFVSAQSDTSSIPETATSFRIVITPTETVEIGYFDINNYSGQVSVTFNK